MTLIVGYDGSDESRSALLWALREAPAGEDVLPFASLETEPSPLPVLALVPHAPGEADRVAARIAARWNDDGRALGDGVELRFERGRPAETLAAAADREQARLIVIGHRPGRRAAGLRASVAEDLVRLAPCPVVVVR